MTLDRFAVSSALLRRDLLDAATLGCMGRLDGKVALISGGARGQGAAEADAFVREGAAVVVGDVLDDEGRAVTATLGSSARYVHLDVTKEEQWATAVQTATTEFGGLDVLINNAGIGSITPILGGKVDDYMRVVMVNQVGVYLGMVAAAPVMWAARRGSIINISSIYGLVGAAGMSGYVSSKFAVRGLTKTAALELGHRGIRVNSVHPGYIDTPMIRTPEAADEIYDNLATHVPARRLGTVDDIASLAVFLASDESSYFNGAEFTPDGGLTAGLDQDHLISQRRMRRPPQQ